MEEKDESYIPKSIAEAHMYLDAYLVDKETFKNFPEESVMGVAHMTLGRWMRNRWHLWWSNDLHERVKDKTDYPSEKPELVEMFNNMGIMQADDMSAIIIKSYHNKLNGKPFDLELEVLTIQEFYKQQDKEMNDNYNSLNLEQ